MDDLEIVLDNRRCGFKFGDALVFKPDGIY